MGKPLANRDDIWRKPLLIDGKVSAEITTTPLADAIAGIQLYINRTVAGDERGRQRCTERQFFKDWDTYNKRYSTWAGVSQLVYYPKTPH